MSYDFDSAKEKYRQLCAEEPSINVYMQDWFLDAACESEDDWRVILVERKDKIVAAFPFQYVKIKGMWRINNPWQAARMGVWVRDRYYRSKSQKLDYYEELVDEIISNLPPYDEFSISFSSDFKNWQPFYWHGFNADVMYSQIIRPKNVKDGDLKTHISKSRRKRINRAENGFEIFVNDISIEKYCEFFERSYQERGKHISYSKERFIKLLRALKEHNAMEIRAVRKDGEIIAENIVFVDKMRKYHQFGTQRADKYTDAKSYASFDSVKSCILENKICDFEGSMIHGVCKFNASFNPEWEPYYRIYKSNLKVKILRFLWEKLRRFIN